MKQEKQQGRQTKAPSVDLGAKFAKVSDERLADLFTAAFEKIANGAKKLCVPEFECTVTRGLRTSPVVDVRVTGLGGTTTQDEFCQKDKKTGKVLRLIEGAGSVSFKLDDGTDVKFVFGDCLNADAIDYIVRYKLA